MPPMPQHRTRMKPNSLFRTRYSYLFKTSKGIFLLYISKNSTFLKCDEELYLILSKSAPGEVLQEELLQALPPKIVDMLMNIGFLCHEFDDEDYIDKLRFINEASQHDKTHLGMVIAPTLDCNFACPYCFEKSKRASYMTQEVEKRLCDFILENCNGAPISLYWYGGEPLLARNSIERILNRLHKKTEISDHVLISNGYLLNPLAYKIFDSTFPLNDVQITLDGNSERHNTLRALKGQRQTTTYNSIVNHIKEFAQSHPSCNVHVRVNVDKTNYSDYELTAQYFSSLTLDNIHVYPGMIRLENKEQTQSIEPAFGRWEIAEFIYQQAIVTNTEEELFPKVVYAKNCVANRVNSYIVGPEGEIYKCWNDVSNPNKIVGNIWEEEITNPLLYYRYHSSCSCFNDPDCRDCFYLPICNGKCSWYQMKNKYEGGLFNLCQCLLKAPGMRDKILEKYYEYAAK